MGRDACFCQDVEKVVDLLFVFVVLEQVADVGSGNTLVFCLFGYGFVGFSYGLPRLGLHPPGYRQGVRTYRECARCHV